MPSPASLNCPQTHDPRGVVVRGKIWIDLDNSPHVPFFIPIIEELKDRGYELFITARDAYQVCELLEYYGLSAHVVGRHYGKSRILKLLGTCWRAFQLAILMRQHKPDISLSHGSRGCVLASFFLGVESIAIADYEFANKFGIGIGTKWLFYPEVVPSRRVDGRGPSVLRYPGIKEDVYLSRFRPDPTLRSRLGIASDDSLVTVRPPATEAHYHNPESEALLVEALRMFAFNPKARVLLLPRNDRQKNELLAGWADEIASGKIRIPQRVEDGLNIIWNSDLVISGGGTMNREAAAMGVPVYSIFRGKTGAVDQYLAEQGRLILLESVEDVRTKIKVVRRQKSDLHLKQGNSLALETIVRHTTSIAESKVSRSNKKHNRWVR
jgi:predicted glycosyltransferase